MHVVAVTESPDSPFARAAAGVVALPPTPADADPGDMIAMAGKPPPRFDPNRARTGWRRGPGGPKPHRSTATPIAGSNAPPDFSAMSRAIVRMPPEPTDSVVTSTRVSERKPLSRSK